jgi:hypothetical protein
MQLDSVGLLEWKKRTRSFHSTRLDQDVMIVKASPLRLREVMASDADGSDPETKTTAPALILLSHHEYYSNFDDSYPIPAQQLRDVISSELPVLWFWGHEHPLLCMTASERVMGYKLSGAALGMGACPSLASPFRTSPIATASSTTAGAIKRTRTSWATNGFITLEFDGPSLDVRYYDLFSTPLLTERWTSDGKGHFARIKVSRRKPRSQAK